MTPSGRIADGYEPVRHAFASMLAAEPGYSAQVAAYVDGQPVVDLVGGRDASDSTMTGVFSVSKGVAALVIAMLVESGALDLDRPVSHYWAEFASGGKAHVLVRELLSHQAGLVGLAAGLTTEGLVDSTEAARALAQMHPLWRPGSTFGYHGLTVGILMEELVRRVTGGQQLQELFEREIRGPRSLEFYLGLPAALEQRFQPVLPAPDLAGAGTVGDGELEPSDGLAELMYNLRPGETLLTSSASPNLRAIRAAGPAAVGGVGTARGLAAVYAAAIGPVGGQPAILRPRTIELMSQQQVWGRDRLLDVDMVFAVVFMKPQPRMDFGSYRAFGHDGAGGAIGFADPAHHLGFGYVPQPMQPPGGADPKGVRLATITRACAARVRRGFP